MPILIAKYIPISVWYIKLVFDYQKAIIFLRNSKITSSTITKLNLAIRLNCEFRLSFPSQCNILDVANTSIAKELLSFLHLGGLQLNCFKHRCQESTNCYSHFPTVYTNVFHKIANYFCARLGYLCTYLLKD